MKEIRLIFQQWQDAKESKYCSTIDPNRKEPFLVATLDTFDAGRQSEIEKIYLSFIKANTRKDDKIFFAFGSGNRFDELERSLEALGDPFREVVPANESRKSLLYRFFVPARTRQNVLIASTRTFEIITKLFDTYSLEWYAQSQFWFAVAEKEPSDWFQQLLNLLGPEEERLLNSNMIEDTYCVMNTMWEHGMQILTDKMPRAELEETARDIASENGITLTISD